MVEAIHAHYNKQNNVHQFYFTLRKSMPETQKIGSLPLSKKIQEKFRKVPYTLPFLGSITYSINKRPKPVLEPTYYPFGRPEINPHYINALQLTGTAGRLELIALKHLEKILSGDHLIASAKGASESRKEQLKRRGTIQQDEDPHDKVMPLREYIAILEKHLKESDRAARTKGESYW